LPDRIGMPEVTFHWNSVAPYIQSAIRYLHVTANGRQWIANLYSNVFRAERDIALADRSNDVARLCPNPADGQRRLIAPLTGRPSLSTSPSHGSCFLRTAARGAEPDKIAQIPAIGIKRVLLRSTDVLRDGVRSALQSDDRRRLVMTIWKKPLAVLALGLAVTALASPSYAQRAGRDVSAARAAALHACSGFADEWGYAYRACMAEHGQAE